MTDPWLTDELDLAAYLTRIGAAAEPPSLAALTRLQAAHGRAFTFDNLDVLLGDHPGVTLPAVQAKFVGRGRGGYCFEHATLFAAALDRLGYAVTRHLGRVGDFATAARTHLVPVVDLDGERWLCDVGIGRPPLAPLPMSGDGGEVTAGGWRHGIRRVSDGPHEAWAVARWVGGAWEHAQTTDLAPVRPVDVAMGHHWTSTHPSSYFTTTLMCVRHGTDPDGTPTVTSVTHESVTVRRPDRDTDFRAIAVDEIDTLPALLSDLGAGLTDDEAARVVDKVTRLRGR